jgi:hypothetical protein
MHARCLINGAHEPGCNFTLNAESRASGLAQITRVPDANIKFVSCGIYMDGTIVNSTSCFQVRMLLPVGTAQHTGRIGMSGATSCKAGSMAAIGQEALS